jgi:hypothetical protein
MMHAGWHVGCSAPGATYNGGRGRLTVLYVRRSYYVEHPAGPWRPQRYERRWERVGVMCLACGGMFPDPPAEGGSLPFQHVTNPAASPGGIHSEPRPRRGTA